MAFLHYVEAQDVFCHTCVMAIRQKKILLSHNAATPIRKFIILGIIALSLYMPVLLVIYSMHLNLNCFLSSSLKTSKGFSYWKDATMLFKSTKNPRLTMRQLKLSSPCPRLQMMWVRYST